jgi:hypothetical protein
VDVSGSSRNLAPAGAESDSCSAPAARPRDWHTLQNAIYSLYEAEVHNVGARAPAISAPLGVVPAFYVGTIVSPPDTPLHTARLHARVGAAYSYTRAAAAVPPIERGSKRRAPVSGTNKQRPVKEPHKFAFPLVSGHSAAASHTG